MISYEKEEKASEASGAFLDLQSVRKGLAQQEATKGCRSMNTERQRRRKEARGLTIERGRRRSEDGK